MERNRRSSSGRRTSRAQGAREIPKQISEEELRDEAVRRARSATPAPADAPLAVAAAAILYGSGRRDFREREIERGVDRLRQVLRDAYGLDVDEADRVAGDVAWARVRDVLAEQLAPQTVELWLADVEAVAMIDGVLHLRAPADRRAWVERRYGERIERLAGCRVVIA